MTEQDKNAEPLGTAALERLMQLCTPRQRQFLEARTTVSTDVAAMRLIKTHVKALQRWKVTPEFIDAYGAIMKGEEAMVARTIKARDALRLGALGAERIEKYLRLELTETGEIRDQAKLGLELLRQIYQVQRGVQRGPVGGRLNKSRLAGHDPDDIRKLTIQATGRVQDDGTGETV